MGLLLEAARVRGLLPRTHTPTRLQLPHSLTYTTLHLTLVQPPCWYNRLAGMHSPVQVDGQVDFSWSVVFVVPWMYFSAMFLIALVVSHLPEAVQEKGVCRLAGNIVTGVAWQNSIQELWENCSQGLAGENVGGRCLGILTGGGFGVWSCAVWTDRLAAMWKQLPCNGPGSGTSR